MRRILIVIAVLVLGGAAVSADFSYTQTTRVTGRHASEHDSLHAGCGSAQRAEDAYHRGQRRQDGHLRRGFGDHHRRRCRNDDANRFQEEAYAVITFAEMKQAMQAMRAQLAQPSAGGADAAAGAAGQSSRCDEGHRQ